MAKTVQQLADEVFALVELDQGYGFVSDGLGASKSHEAFWNAVRNHHTHTLAAALKLRGFLFENGELNAESN